MTTLAELRDTLRTLLNDGTAGAYLWSDESLNRHLNDAIAEYGRHFPRESVALLATVAGQAQYDLPLGCDRVLGVWQEDTALMEGGDAYGTGYRIFGGKLLLMPVPDETGEEVRVEHLGPHALLVADEDASTAPEADDDLVLALAAARAVEGLAVEDAKRRFEGAAGETTEPAAAAHLGRWTDGLRERKRRLRTRTLLVR